MAQLLSPGVATVEIDQSFIEAGAPTVGAVLIGRTLKGPAYQPILVSNFDEFQQRFGGTNVNYQLPYAAKNYLKNSNSLVVIRVLGHDDGTDATSGYSVGNITGISDTSGSVSTTGSILATIHHSGTIGVVSLAGVAQDANKFVISFGSLFSVTASFLTSSAEYIGKVLNTDPTKYSTYGHYLAEVYRYKKPAASASWHAVSIQSASFKDFLRDYEPGVTTWIKSQPLGGVEFDLLKFYTRADGRATNDEIKITISNIKQSPAPTINPYGSFDLLVRKFDDTDLRPVILESFTQLNFNPDDKNYILRRIGDIYEQFDTTQRKFVVTKGTFPNKSKYIRVELNDSQNFPAEALPWGFRGYPRALYSGSSTVGANIVPQMPYTETMSDGNGNFNQNICWGVSFVSGGIADRMRAFPDGMLTQAHLSGADIDFSLKHLSGNYVQNQLRYCYTTSATSYQSIFASASLQKFTLPFRGGFDGWDLRVTDPLYLANDATESDIGVVSLKRAVDTVANPDAVDMNMIAVPGVHNLKVTDYVRNMVNERKDVFYPMDITGSSVDEAVNGLKNRELDDNYVAAYYPDLKLNDRVNNRIVRVSPSVGVLGAIAYSDRVGQVFFAPAGMNRGGLAPFDIVDVQDRLDYDDRNTLYENRINPIATFPSEGIVVWGQKTLQLRPSALDRVNVRRLLIFAKKTIATLAKGLLFEPGNPQTWQRFINRVNPILDKIRQDQGISRFKVVMDTTTNTPDVIDRNEMKGKIFLEPTKAAELITLDFVITNAGVQFAG